MKLNIQFKEGEKHAWLITNESRELFFSLDPSSVVSLDGHLTCGIPSDIVEDAMDALMYMGEGDNTISGIFVCIPTPDETKVYQCTSHVRMAGGDIVAFITPMMTVH